MLALTMRRSNLGGEFFRQNFPSFADLEPVLERHVERYADKNYQPKESKESTSKRGKITMRHLHKNDTLIIEWATL